jgi:hypothetical protein
MRKFVWIFIAVITLTWLSCDTLKSIEDSVNTATGGGGVTDTEIVNGLKQALEIGTNNAVGVLNKTDGYFKDPIVKILFPPDAVRAADKLRQLGMGQLVDDFVMTLNRGAESAAREAGPIFVDAIKQMTFADARQILGGADNAATEYFKGKTTAALTSKFAPVINNALSSNNCTKHWTQITSTYNKIPLVTKVETDLGKYATGKALDGLFHKLQDEEKKIRTNPAARVTDLLKKVFGSVKK